MCLGVPGKIVEIEPDALGMHMGRVSFGGIRRRSASPTRPKPRSGDYVIVHVGFAISKIDEEEAQKVFAISRRWGSWRSSTCLSPGCRSLERSRPRREVRRRVPRRGPGAALVEAIRRARHAALDADGDLRRPDAHASSGPASTSCCPTAITLVHGPGCPVCVTPLELIDKAHRDRAAPRGDLHLLRRHAARARARRPTCSTAKAEGGDVRIVYSPLDAVKLAAQNPDREVVFFAVGFETTAPANAMAVWQAHRRGLDELLDLVLARARAAGDGGDPRRAGQPRAGIPRRRPRLRGHGLPGVRADRREVPDAHRRHRLRAARPAAGRPT